MIYKTFSTLALWLLLIATSLAAEIDPAKHFNLDLSKPIHELGPLGISLDYIAATTSGGKQKKRTGKRDIRNIVFTSFLKFNQPVSAFSDAQLFKMAEDAFNEMRANYDKYKFYDQWDGFPTVMNILAVDNEIYLASSQKGKTWFARTMYTDTEVEKSLQRCEAMNIDLHGHRNDAKCGEVWSVRMFMKEHPDVKRMNGKGGRILAVEADAAGNPIRVRRKPPCGDVNEVKSTPSTY
jgi:hypothetical protein